MQSSGKRACSGFLGDVVYEVCKLMGLIAMYHAITDTLGNKISNKNGARL